jgi:threonine aldolase
VICHERAHIQTDEGGATEFYTRGAKLFLTKTNDGKIDLGETEKLIAQQVELHGHMMRAISIAQPTELGTVYTPDEVEAIGAFARAHKMLLHMDGARFANAVASLGAAPKEITWQAGIDALCFGGTKNGTHVGEAVVFFNHDLAREFDYRCKQAGQLASKMRFLAAPWVGMLQDGAWLRHAAQANNMARLLNDLLVDIPQIRILFPRQANAVFAELPPYLIVALRQQGWKFYTFIGQGGCRLMCAWDTREEDVREFIADVRRLLQEAPKDLALEITNHRKIH